ncbi:hypothetical protein D7I45_01400 [Apilactobacillus bombintestini]|uniref:Uncharacterized protein n=1 Tax=Apilactobacillus bombintestini TaxID=2419772 RepID=A0A387AYW4_9LACO|nr:hypothetical protein D7I45_01400 [Apilactobacillus bombintestini]
MVANNDWLLQQIEQIKQDQNNFKLSSFLDGAVDLVQEQQKRLQQAHDELDGRTWSPDKW